MSDLLKHIYNACDPIKPATAEYYLDCSAARGSSALVQEFRYQLRRAEDQLCFLFSGHIGCGKSSELEALKSELSKPTATPRYFPVLLNVAEYLDDYDVAPSDIMLAIVTELAAAMQNELGQALQEGFLHKRVRQFFERLTSDIAVSDVQLSQKIMGTDIKGKVTLLKRDPGAREKVREAYLPHLGSLVSEINEAFDEARLRLKQWRPPAGEQPYDDIVVLVDNLEKIQRIKGMEAGLPSQRELFVERYAQLTGMKAHLVYTAPLRLVRSADGPKLTQRYGPLFVLPMVKVIERSTRKLFAPGRDCLRAMLQKRIGNTALEKVFAPEALDLLLTYSGGHVRNLMTFVQNASAYTEELPIALDAARRARSQSVRTYSTSIPESHWKKLVKLDQSHDQQIPGGDDEYLLMLENLSVLEYINGGDSADASARDEPWYAVNPIVRELQKFKALDKSPSTERKRKSPRGK